jgi:hypothetical protein
VTPCGLSDKTFRERTYAIILRIEESKVLIQSHKNRELIAMTSTGATIKHASYSVLTQDLTGAHLMQMLLHVGFGLIYNIVVQLPATLMYHYV